MEDPDLAVALRCQPGGEGAPRVAAKERGAITARILAVARDHGVGGAPGRQSRPATREPRIHSPIPVAAFVAEILAHLYHADRQLARRHGHAAQP